MNAEGTIRIRVIFTGRVQGVGFRFTVQALSHGRTVSGFVRNLPDGTVEMEAQGTHGELDAFLSAIRAQFSGNIRHENRDRIAPVAAPGFEIRY